MYSGVYAGITGMISTAYDTFFEVSIDIPLVDAPRKSEIIASLKEVFPSIQINDFASHRSIAYDYFEALLGFLTLKFTLFEEEKFIRLVVLADRERLTQEENERMIPSDFLLLARLLKSVGFGELTLTLNCEPSTLAARLLCGLESRGFLVRLGDALSHRSAVMDAMKQKIKRHLQLRTGTLMMGAVGAANSITEEGDPLYAF
jgi:hypothetical protein